jgi:preprotein translocase subunit SecF
MLGQQLALPVELLRTTIVGPQVGAELFQQGMLAVLVASLAISAYLAVRFEWRQAIGILVSVLHDGLVAIGLLALFDIEFDLNVIAGLMAVIGYSLNDSIVISDRLRDLLGSRTRMGIHECSDVAIKATFSRTMITSGTTLFTVGALLLFGGDALYGFSFTLFAGILVGTLSSITVASTVQELLGLSPRPTRKKRRSWPRRRDRRAHGAHGRPVRPPRAKRKANAFLFHSARGGGGPEGRVGAAGVTRPSRS